MRLLKLLLLSGLFFLLFSAEGFSQEEDYPDFRDPKTSPYNAQYPGGESGWFKAVEKSVRFKDFPQGNLPDTISIVMQFFVPKDGAIQEVICLSGDKRIEEPIRNMVLASGNWIPARQGGRSVKSYRKVKLHFRFNRVSMGWALDRNTSAYFVL